MSPVLLLLGASLIQDLEIRKVGDGPAPPHLLQAYLRGEELSFALTRPPAGMKQAVLCYGMNDGLLKWSYEFDPAKFGPEPLLLREGGLVGIQGRRRSVLLEAATGVLKVARDAPKDSTSHPFHAMVGHQGCIAMLVGDDLEVYLPDGKLAGRRSCPSGEFVHGVRASAHGFLLRIYATRKVEGGMKAVTWKWAGLTREARPSWEFGGVPTTVTLNAQQRKISLTLAEGLSDPDWLVGITSDRGIAVNAKSGKAEPLMVLPDNVRHNPIMADVDGRHVVDAGGAKYAVFTTAARTQDRRSSSRGGLWTFEIPGGTPAFSVEETKPTFPAGMIDGLLILDDHDAVVRAVDLKQNKVRWSYPGPRMNNLLIAAPWICFMKDEKTLRALDAATGAVKADLPFAVKGDLHHAWKIQDPPGIGSYDFGSGVHVFDAARCTVSRLGPDALGKAAQLFSGEGWGPSGRRFDNLNHSMDEVTPFAVYELILKAP